MERDVQRWSDGKRWREVYRYGARSVGMEKDLQKLSDVRSIDMKREMEQDLQRWSDRMMDGARSIDMASGVQRAIEIEKCVERQLWRWRDGSKELEGQSKKALQRWSIEQERVGEMERDRMEQELLKE